MESVTERKTMSSPGTTKSILTLQLFYQRAAGNNQWNSESISKCGEEEAFLQEIELQFSSS